MSTTNKTMTTAESMADAVANKVDQAAQSAQDTIEKVSDAAHPAVEKIASGAHQAVDKIAGVASKAADTFGMTSSQIKEMPAMLNEACCDHFRDKPLRTIGYAVAAGFLVGWFLKKQ